MTNHLIAETSPYLLQHVDNPVDWYPWCDDALQRARREDKPILLSIGYAACHWCHVMAHESFEDEQIADFMNRHFVNIKVDREERPDLDDIYMSAVVALTGQGGWPLTVVLTPDGRPFFGGTYFPPTPRHGLPSFPQVLQGVLQAWQSRRDEIETSASEISGHLRRGLALDGAAGPLEPALLHRALATISSSFDAKEGGFSPAPKFPSAMILEFLLWMHRFHGHDPALQMFELTLQKMARGGIYDQLGGGFARYATDGNWLIPHFEKMLYDNALLARVYLHAWQVTGNELYRRIVEETLDFVAGEMRHRDGGFYSSYDADSEGEEGRFYLWSATEVREVLGADAELFMRYYDVTEQGNWEGRNILNIKEDAAVVAADFQLDPAQLAARLEAARRKLYRVREQRVRPGLDDKVLTAWNGLMLAAFAEAGRVLGRADYTEIAERNATFLQRTMRTEGGRLLRTWKAGHRAKYNGYLEDYACLADGLLALYQNTFDENWFVWARELTQMMLAHFSDEAGGFFDTSDDHEALLHRPRELFDKATPSANAMAMQVLLRLSLYTGEGRYWDIAQQAVKAMSENMAHHAAGFAHWLGAAAFILAEPREAAVVGRLDAPDTQALLNAIWSEYRPNLVVAAGTDNGEKVPLLANRPQVEGKATAYICRRFACQQPVTEAAALAAQLSS